MWFMWFRYPGASLWDQDGLHLSKEGYGALGRGLAADVSKMVQGIVRSGQQRRHGDTEHGTEHGAGAPAQGAGEAESMSASEAGIAASRPMEPQAKRPPAPTLAPSQHPAGYD
jgi:hypothetical protein